MAGLVIPTVYTAVDRSTGVIDRISRAIDRANTRVEAFNKRFESIEKISKKVAVIAAVVGTAIAAPFALAIREAIKFQDILADVTKTTGLHGKALDQYGNAMLRYSFKTRSSIEDLLSIGVTGGTLGVAKEQLDAFTKSADTFNIALGSDFGGADVAIRSVAGFKNLFTETRGQAMTAADQINKVGSAINALTSHEAKAPEMTDFITRIGSSLDALKPKLTDAIAMSALYSSSGISPEFASSGIKEFYQLAGRNIDRYAKQMKMSTSAAKELYNNNPMEFIQTFAKSLSGLKGDRLVSIMKELKINGSGMTSAIGTLASRWEDFAKFQAISNEQFKEGTSLAEEAATKNNTLAGKIKMAKNSFRALAITVGSELLPQILPLIERITSIIGRISEWIQRNQGLAKGIMYGALALGGIAFVISGLAGLITGIITIYKAWIFVQTAINIAMRNNPMGLIITLVGALVAGIVWLLSKVEGFGEQWQSIWEFIKAAFMAHVSFLKLGFLGIVDAFASMAEAVAKAWYWLQNKMGMMSDESYAHELARIESEKNARIGAIRDTYAEMEKYSDRVSQGIEWKLRWKSDTSQPGGMVGVNSMDSFTEPKIAYPSVDAQKAIIEMNAAKSETKNTLEIILSGNTNDAKVGKNTGEIPISIKPTFTGGY